MSKHADLVFAAVESRDSSSLTTSWRRCVERYRLHPDEAVVPQRDLAALNEAMEREALLIAAARPCLDAIWETAREPAAAVFLADKSGLIIDCRTDRFSDYWGRDSSCFLGIRCHESVFGSCGIGTCLADDRALVFAQGEHFLTCFESFSGAAAPISGPNGRLVGTIVYAATQSVDLPGRLMLHALTGLARRISVELLAAAHPRCRLVLADQAGLHLDAVLAVDGSDYVHGATRSARRLLGLNDNRLASPISLRELQPNEVASQPSGDLASSEARIIAETMDRFNGNRVAVAKALGISRSTLYRKLASHA